MTTSIRNHRRNRYTFARLRERRTRDLDNIKGVESR